jgi:hydroxycarboxylate dehydrogenase B
VQRGEQPRLISDVGALSSFDGNRGFGQVAGEVVVRHGVARARELGAAAVALRNVGHLGRLGRWAEMAAAEGILSMQFVNTSGGSNAEVLLVAPFGGQDRRMSVNPMCVGLPRRGRDPIIMDATIAATAGGKVMAAANRGDPLPPGQIVDRDGRPSTRPEDLFEGGAILPFGDHRGYALAFMIDVLAGALTGGGTSPQPKHPRMNNLGAIFIDPAKVGGADYDGDLGLYATWMKQAPSLLQGGEVLLPGEIEIRVADRRRREGIPLDDTTLSLLQGAATRLSAAQLAV